MTHFGYIRFVGGPWDNRVACVELLPVLRIPEEAEVLACVIGGDYIPRPETKHCQYVLHTFKSHEEDADGFPLLVFQQYLHQSLCPDPPRWAYEEVGFPPLPEQCFARFLRLLSTTTVCKLACGGGRRPSERAD